MENKTLIKILIWLACAFAIASFAFSMLSAADSIANIFGVLCLMVFGYISYATKCFTKNFNS